LDAVEKHVTVRYNCAVERLQPSSESRVELLDKAGKVLGEYDLVVDASGVGSSLRRYRVQESAEDLDPEQTDRSAAFRKAYTGVSMVHGVIQDPEVSCHPSFVEKLGQGTVSILGPKGKSFTVQRFGADPADHRASFYYWYLCDHPDHLKKAIGLSADTTSQWRTGEDLEKMRAFLRQDMGSGWEPPLAKVVDAIDFASIRPILLHDRTPTFRENQLPLICVGDALHVVPPWTGAGGNLAMADASDLGAWLCKLVRNDGRMSIAELRSLERRCMTRAAKAADDAHEFPQRMEKWLQVAKELDDVSSVTLAQCGDIFCESCCTRLCFKSLLCCCRPLCNCCGCCRC
jgi:2-polyprenyl-6-methoxyphenol hydroxylase-like FAD-dependent oxidoreductase